MNRRYITFISVLIIALFVMMSFSNTINTNIKINPEISKNNLDKKEGAYGHYYWGLGNPVGSTYLWTPLILVNSPYGGCASASASQSFKVKYSVVDWSSCTQSGSTSKLSGIKNGAAEGYFGLDQWTIYPVVLKWSPSGGGCPGPKPANYVAEITNTKYDGTDHITTYNLLPPGSKSDSNEITHFTKNGFNSITFYNGFNTNNWGKNSADITFCPSGSGYYSFTTQYKHEIGTSFSINAVFSGTVYIVSGSLSLIANNGVWDWGTFSYHYYSFTYKFPNSIGGKYEMEALNTGNSKNMAYAFRWC